MSAGSGSDSIVRVNGSISSNTVNGSARVSLFSQMVNFSFGSVNSGQTRLTQLTRLTPLTRLTQSTQRVNSVNPGDSVNSVRRFDDSTRRFGKN
ncbi:hypothetical protein Hanom_Chr07g00661221 [Helianthus anomalus]